MGFQERAGSSISPSPVYLPRARWSLLTLNNVFPLQYDTGSFRTVAVEDAVYGADGDSIIVADQANGAYEITRDYTVVWHLTIAELGGTPDVHGATALSYCPDTDEVLIALRTGIPSRIVKVKNGVVTATLTATTLGNLNLGVGRVVEWDRQDTTKFWIADMNNHVVVQTDFTGTVYFQFGVYGVSGSDATHLDTPLSVFPQTFGRTAVGAGSNFIVIGDGGNNRVLMIEIPAGTIYSQMPFPNPIVRLLAGNMTAIVSYGLTQTSGFNFIGGDYYHPQPRFIIPHGTNMISGHPTDPFLVLVAWDEGVYEYDLRDLSSEWVGPSTAKLWKTQAALAAVPIYSTPIPDWYRKNKTFTVKATQAGTLEIEVARWAEDYGDWSGDWDVIDSKPLVANTALSYLMERPVGVCRLKVTLDVNGTVEAWANLSP